MYGVRQDTWDPLRQLIVQRNKVHINICSISIDNIQSVTEHATATSRADFAPTNNAKDWYKRMLYLFSFMRYTVQEPENVGNPMLRTGWKKTGSERVGSQNFGQAKILNSLTIVNSMLI